MSDIAVRPMGWISRVYGGVLAAMHAGFLMYVTPVTLEITHHEKDPWVWVFYVPIIPATVFMIVCGVMLAAGRERVRWLFLAGVLAMPVVQLFAIMATMSYSWDGGGGRTFPYTMLLSAVATLYHLPGLPLLLSRLRFANPGV